MANKNAEFPSIFTILRLASKGVSVHILETVTQKYGSGHLQNSQNKSKSSQRQEIGWNARDAVKLAKENFPAMLPISFLQDKIL